MSTHEEHRIWKTTSHYPFEKFGAELIEYTQTGNIPSQGDQNVRYALELQKQRLKDKALLMKYEFTPRGHFADTSGPGREWKDDHYISRMEYRTTRLTRKIYRAQKKIYEKGENCIFYQIITDAYNWNVIGDDTHACPNCGAPSPIKVLENGCPYCGTFFKMSDLFPKTTNFYFIRDVGGTEKEVYGSLKKVMFSCMLIIFLINLLRIIFVDGINELFIFEMIGNIIGSVIIGGALGYFLYSISLLITVFREAGKSIPMLFNVAGSSKRFVTLMKRYSPEFSFEYFSGKVVAILKMILFSDDADELTYYNGQPLGNMFTDIIDSSYAGACALKQFKVQGDYCYVTVDAYMEDLYDNGRRIYERNEKFRITLCKNIRKPINLHFSIQAIQCKSCGSSFNATKQKCCPNCSTPFELRDEDWVVTKIQRK